MTDPKVTNDPELYARMCVPHPTLDEANAAWLAFAEDGRAARERHRIADVVVLSCGRALVDGKSQLVEAQTNMGASTRNEAMLFAIVSRLLRVMSSDLFREARAEDARTSDSEVK